MNKNTYKLLGILFPALLVLAFVVNLILPDKSFSDEENRILQSMPAFSFASYKEGRFEKKLENYANDQFMMRNQLIRVKSAADSAIGKTYSNSVFSCKDNYLMEDITVPDEKKVEKNIESIADFKKKYPSLEMSFLLAPNAANILSDKLPLFAAPRDQNKDIDSFYKKMKDIGITTIDVRPSFIENKDKMQLYYRTDHHWTSDGAYLAFNQIAKTLNLENDVEYKPFTVKTDFRGTLSSKSGFNNGLNDTIVIYLPKPDSNYKNSVIYYFDSKEKTTEFYKPSNLKIKDAYTVFGGSNHPIYTIDTPVDNNKSLLLIKDSYANSVIPFLSQCYRKIVVVDPRYFYDSIDKIIDTHNITDVMFLYNANTIFKDDSLDMMLS